MKRHSIGPFSHDPLAASRAGRGGASAPRCRTGRTRRLPRNAGAGSCRARATNRRGPRPRRAVRPTAGSPRPRPETRPVRIRARRRPRTGSLSRPRRSRPPSARARALLRGGRRPRGRPRAGRIRARASSRIARPRRGVEVGPALERELPLEAGGAVGREVRRLDQERPRAAHRVDERRLPVPAREQQQPGRERLVERALHLDRPPPALVQALAGEVAVERRAVAVDHELERQVGMRRRRRSAASRRARGNGRRSRPSP